MDVNLVLFKKNGSQKSFALPSSITIIGRRHDCDLCIPLMPVSKRHCELDRNNETLKIRDLDSHNGTFVNGERINGDKTARAGDYLQVGPLMFQIQIDGEPEKTTPPLDIEAKAETPLDEPMLMTDEDDDIDFGDLDLDDNDSDSFLDELEDL